MAAVSNDSTQTGTSRWIEGFVACIREEGTVSWMAGEPREHGSQQLQGSARAYRYGNTATVGIAKRDFEEFLFARKAVE